MEKPVDLAAGFQAYEALVYNYLRRMGTPRDAARDLAQETFLRAILGARRFRGDASVETWLLGIARNVFREWLRRHREEPVEDSGLEDPDAAHGSETRRLDVERTLARLDSEQREVLVLRFVLDLSGEQVAALLGTSHEAVRQRVVRAKAEFRRLWGDHEANG